MRSGGTAIFNPFSAVGLTFLTYFGSQLIASILLVFTPRTGIEAFEQFIYILLVGLLSFYFIKWFLDKQSIPLSTIGVTKLKPSFITQGLFGFFSYVFIYLIAVGVLSAIFKSLDVNQEQDVGFSAEQTSIGLIIVFVSLVIIPPLVEEFIMRGFLYTGLRTRLDPMIATFITSSIFAVAHLPGAKEGLLWIGAIDTFILSIILCYLREKNQSIWPAVIIHMLKNSLAFSYKFLI